jgi:hypothetical protein
MQGGRHRASRGAGFEYRRRIVSLEQSVWNARDDSGNNGRARLRAGRRAACDRGDTIVAVLARGAPLDLRAEAPLVSPSSGDIDFVGARSSSSRRDRLRRARAVIPAASD